jgi:hypothetical protein
MGCPWWKLPLVLIGLNGLCFSGVEGDRPDHEFPDIERSRVCECVLTQQKKGRRSTSCYQNFNDNPFINKRMQASMAPYLVPLEHPLKPILDKIFLSPRVIENKVSLREAGFTILFSQKKSQIIVARHEAAPGYLFKMYLSSTHVHRKGMDGWKLLTTRCSVAHKIKELIKKKRIRWFTVADKWLYPLPADCQHTYSKHEPVILVVKDMDVYDCRTSAEAWRSKSCRRLLRELYSILGRGYGSSFLSGNIPYTRGGKFAFIDTEYDKRKIPLSHLKRFFSEQVRPYWDRIVRRDPKGIENNVPKPVLGLDWQLFCVQ